MVFQAKEELSLTGTRKTREEEEEEGAKALLFTFNGTAIKGEKSDRSNQSSTRTEMRAGASDEELSTDDDLSDMQFQQQNSFLNRARRFLNNLNNQRSSTWSTCAGNSRQEALQKATAVRKSSTLLLLSLLEMKLVALVELISRERVLISRGRRTCYSRETKKLFLSLIR